MTGDTVMHSRRDVLKKLAAASATAGVAATIVSSRAFADGGTINSQPTGTTAGSVTFSIQSFTDDSAVIRASLSGDFPAGTCPFPAPAGSVAARREYAWAVAEVNLQGSPGPSITGTTFSSTLLDQTVSATTGNQDFNGTYDVTLTVRWICRNRKASSAAAWRCRAFRTRITQSPTQGQTAGTASASSTTEPAVDQTLCNTAPITPN